MFPVIHQYRNYIRNITDREWRQDRVKVPTRGEDTKMWQH